MKCPGQDSRYWKPGAIFEDKCPKCGNSIEFFKDDTARLCKKCGHRFLNPAMDFGCASYCKYADQCIGNLPPELIAQKEDLLKDRVAIEMKRYFKQDYKGIGHATQVAKYAEQIGKEEGCNLAVVLTAAYLLNIGIKEAERKHGSTAARYLEEEGPHVARGILAQLEAKEELIMEVCDIIGHYNHPGPEEDINFRVVHDAHLITELQEREKEDQAESGEPVNTVEKSFLTKSGRALAKKLFLKDKGS